jgi:hypothetical protein
MKQLGGEPVWITSGLQAVLALLVSFGVFDLDNEQAGLIMAVAAGLAALYTAWATRDTLVAVGTGAAVAVLDLLASYGLDLTQDQVSAVTAVIALVAGWAQAKRTEPLASPTFANGAAAGPRYGTQVPVPDPVT